MLIEQAKEVLRIEAEGIVSLIDNLGPEFEAAVNIILACQGRVILTGIGKSGIIGQKIAATFNSTGTPAFFLHPVEAMHGDLGMVGEEDVIMALSYSGETVELKMLLSSLKKRGNAIIALTGDIRSSLALLSDVVINISVPREACPLGLAPTTSTTATMAMGDALAVALINEKNFGERDFRRNHPGGSLGARLKVQVSEVMLTGPYIPKVSPQTSLQEAVRELNQKNMGAVLVVDDQGKLVGIITDGDLRRLVSAGTINFENQRVSGVMTRNPKTIPDNLLAADALSIMQHHEIMALAVEDKDHRVAGILHLHDLLGKGEFRFLV